MMKYYYSSEHEELAKMKIKDDTLYISFGGEIMGLGKESFEQHENHTIVHYNKKVYCFYTSKIKGKRSTSDNCKIGMFPINEDEVVRVDGKYYPFETLSIKQLLRESYGTIHNAVLSAYIDRPMDDPDLALKLLKRLYWKLKDYNIPDDEIMPIKEIEEEIFEISNPSD